MKRFLCAGLASLMLFTSTAFADTGAHVFIGDKLVEYTDQAPVIINERTYIPIRDVFEELGFTVNWDAENKTVSISNDYYQIMLFTTINKMMTISAADLSFNYTKLENDIQIVNDRTMLPLREILESVNYSLGWDAETKSAIITDKNDYDALSAKAAELETRFSGLMNNEGKFEYDPSKPSEELTEEEYAYLDNIFTTFQSLKDIEAPMEFDDISQLTPENVALIKQYIKTITAKFGNVKCPDSLKGLDKNLESFLNSTVDYAASISEIMSDNPDNQDVAFTVGIMFVFKLAGDGQKALEPLENLCKEKNLDLESIFGEKYSDLDSYI